MVSGDAPEAGGRVRLHEGEGPERAARDAVHPDRRAGGRRDKAAPRRDLLGARRGAASFVGEAVRTARACGAVGLLVVRADSAFYCAEVIGACRALGARFSVTVRMNRSVRAAISHIDEDAWTPIKYPA